MIIDDREKNLREVNRIGLLYKIKSFLYTLLIMASASFLVLYFSGSYEFTENLKIINKEEFF